MKKLLYLNNYGCNKQFIEKCVNLDIPRNHIWGIDFLQKEYEVIIPYIPFKSWHPRSLLLNRIKRILTDTFLVIRYWNVDIVYSAYQGGLTLFALMKYLHLSQKRLVIIIHHASSNFFFSTQYNKIIYLSPVIKDIFAPNYNIIRSEYINWEGDKQYYANRYRKEKERYMFISAGRSHRDYSCLEKAINISDVTDKKTIIVCNQLEIDNPYITCVQSSQYGKEMLSYNELVNYYAVSKFMIIPIVSTLQNELCGLTSLVDAIQLGMPVLISNNTNIGIDIEKMHFGWVYRAGDFEDMARKIEKMSQLSEIDYQYMQKRMIEYADSNDYDKFAKKICQVMSSIV